MKKTIFLSLILAFALFSCNGPKPNKTTVSDAIRINQIGYYPHSVKQFILADSTGEKFEILNQEKEIVFSGKLVNNGKWQASGEEVMMGDFSNFKDAGKYTITIDDNIESFPFEIKENLYEEALKASIKSYYFQRASMAIDEKHGGKFARAAGHPDDHCAYHPSSRRSEGKLNSPGGWYDAGDYGKYIVNAALSTGQMLFLVEQYPEAIKDGDLNIPESGNSISDLMDELKYELDWISTMQDEDGGVYHKLTAKSFSGFIMPEDYDLERMIIGKGTAATLNFAAVLAQASRLYQTTDPGWSTQALTSSKKAWKWAMVNNDIAYSNPKDVSTGAYDDDVFEDDFYWAASELFITTKDQQYLDYLLEHPQEYQHQLTNSWKFFIRNNAFHSLLENSDLLSEEFAQELKQSHLKLADGILAQIKENPYEVALERYEWGSNSDVLNQAMILCVAHRISGEEKYLSGAEQINDYIYGKNATAYCFLTGFGSKRVMFAHHRPTGADGIEEPIPGFIAGGPNEYRQDQSQVTYTSEFPAKAYMDVEASYASNEVCINWNAPAVYVLAYLQENRK